MMTSPRAAELAATCASGSGWAVESLPPAITMIIPAAVARLIAETSELVAGAPPSDMLTTLAPFERA